MLRPALVFVALSFGAATMQLVTQLPASAPTHSIAIFAGPTERGPVTATKITSRAQYTNLFGGYVRGSDGTLLPDSTNGDKSATLAYAVDAFFANGGSSAYIVRMISNIHGRATATRVLSTPVVGGTITLTATSPGAWPNNYTQTVGNPPNTYSFGLYAIIGPATSYTGPWPAPDPVHTTPFRLLLFYGVPGVLAQDPNLTGLTLVEDWDGLTGTTAATTLLGSNYVRWSGVNEPPFFDVNANGNGDGPPTVYNDYIVASTVITGFSGGGGDDSFTQVNSSYTSAAQPSDYTFHLLDGISDAGLLVVPQLPQFVGDTGDRLADTIMAAAITYTNGRSGHDLELIGTAKRHSGTTTLAAATAVAGEGLTPGSYTKLYWPWLEVTDPAPGGSTIWLDPAAAVAGLYSRPGAAGARNAVIQGALAEEYVIADGDQATQNELAMLPCTPIRTHSQKTAAQVRAPWRWASR